MTEVRGPRALSRPATRGADADAPHTRVFEIYYDRAPRAGGRTKAERGARRAGSWVLWGEVTQ